MQETQVCCLGQEDPVEKEMLTHSSVLAWEIPRTEEPGGQPSMGSQRESDTTGSTLFYSVPVLFFLFYLVLFHTIL